MLCPDRKGTPQRHLDIFIFLIVEKHLWDEFSRLKTKGSMNYMAMLLRQLIVKYYIKFKKKVHTIGNTYLYDQ